ncbi:hypothetical protein SAMN04488595_104293 [Ralstonia sp. 25mfcol4.1]|uniref:DUF2239 family protein n=1 Tax=Burkholderiaceae TaxID=119060 RepID=UPI0004247BFA|nr:DUF2239 family protein [Ralstonia sp. 25mfcol4.1]SDP09708.1 hypothetical protein SAMN04488595_104293 [Ralstonia sp. 25mfcol4.1]
MEDNESCTAFAGERRLASGTSLEVALAVAAALRADPHQSILAFGDVTGRQVDFDLRGSDADIAARLAPPAAEEGPARKGAGRPKLGVVAREVTLLPRHWEWLGEQPGGASVTLRKLVDAARKGQGADAGVAASRAKAAADRFMSTMLGNQPGYEEASRALYGGDRDRFEALSQAWPADLRDHARKLAAPAFGDDQPNVNA